MTSYRARIKAVVRPVAKRLTKPAFEFLWPRVDARVAEAMRPVPVAEFEEFRRSLPLLLDAISAQNAAARHVNRRFDELQHELWDKAGDLAERVKDLWERVEAVRTEVMYELRYGSQSTGVQSDIEPKVLNPDKVKAQADEVRLNLGSGSLVRERYVNVDTRPLEGVDIVADIANLPFGPGEVTEIHSEHLLEHFPEEALRRRLLPYWVSLLKPGGTFSTVVPDAGTMLAEHAAGRFSFEDLRLVTFGGQEYDGDFHFTMFTSDRLATILREAGLVEVEVKACGRRNGVCYEMELEARRPG